MGVFQHKLKRYPLSNSYPHYTGGNDVNRAAEYILGPFKSAIEPIFRCILMSLSLTITQTCIAFLEWSRSIFSKMPLGLPAVKIIPITA
jgi:hypothetical protein